MTAYRKNNKLIIELDEDALVSGVSMIPSYERETFKVTDRKTYLNYMADNICTYGDTMDNNSVSAFSALLDNLVEEACENDAGVCEL